MSLYRQILLELLEAQEGHPQACIVRIAAAREALHEVRSYAEKLTRDQNPTVRSIGADILQILNPS